MTSVKKVTPGGYMTIYLALTVTVIMALCLALIEGCRYRGISLETECVMDIGMDSILLNIIENCRNSTICLP